MPEYKYFVHESGAVGEPNPRVIGEFNCLEHAVMFIEGYFNRYYNDAIVLVISKGVK